MKLEFIRTRQGNYVAKKPVITYVIESSGNQYSIDITGMYVAEKFSDISDAKKFCQRVEDDLFDADVINNAIEIAMQSVGGAKEFYEKVIKEDVQIILADDGRSAKVWLQFKINRNFWLTSNRWSTFLRVKVITTKYNDRGGTYIMDLIKEELKEMAVLET